MEYFQNVVDVVRDLLSPVKKVTIRMVTAQVTCYPHFTAVALIATANPMLIHYCDS
jgi:hypothetical protein